jgi:acetylornithine/N-succinyldiaminopimelate aminotransferase
MNNIIWSTGHILKYGNMVGSDNCFIYTSDGRRFVDLESGVWCTSLGHNNKRINKVITDQINKITHTGFCYCHPVIEEVAKKILEINHMEGGKCEFLCSGSEAVEYGMRVARSLSNKPLALAFSDSYFGSYGDAAVKSNDKWFVYDRLHCSCARDGNGCTGDCEEFSKIPFSEIGIFLLEPGSSSGLVRFAHPRLIEKIAKRIRENGGLIMSNEITTGIGRTGKWFGYRHYSLQPDIVAMGKGLGNGYPVSATALSKAIAGKLLLSDFHYSQSHQNDPLGAVVAGEVIDIIRESDLIMESAEKGNYLKENLLRLKEEFPLIREVRGKGMMQAIELTGNATLIYEALLEQGFIVGRRLNGEVLRLDPAFTIEKETMDEFLSALREILGKLNETY